MEKIVILAAPRSGTNYLRSLLNSHPDIRMFGEMFHSNWEMPQFHKADPLTADEKSALFRSRFDHPEDFLEKYVWLAVNARRVKAIGFKLLYGQGCDSAGKKGEVWDYLLKNNEVKIIHLKRRNILKREISLTHAMRSGQWSLKKGNNIFSTMTALCLRLCKIKAVYFEPKKCEEFFINNEKMILDYEEYFKGKQVLSIDYEDLIEFFDENISKIMMFIGVDYYPLKSSFLKQNPLPVKLSLKNFKELKNYFEGTRWESFFYE